MATLDRVREFLVRHGVDTAHVQLAEFTIHDALANEYAPERRVVSTIDYYLQ